MTGTDVGLEALRSDANKWATAGNTTSAPAGVIAELALGGADMSMWAVDCGLDRTYDELRTTLQTQLSRAAENFHAIAATLRQTAETYEREEQANAQNLKQTY
ncbi:hypothetical protein [Actinokineospora iranica]|uniref:Excreted virulence factor EspC, type VII ESX diderm n=1 Tax=Actinokineospora iranica TaxID=1271860 RepID=A0A1G6K994_9PSEU|nr:hypothetical protein [Actinokineospora iranica]SDC27401.1 hypothetical protein SAMN05216174_101779 [Actinokineospora iranica]